MLITWLPSKSHKFYRTRGQQSASLGSPVVRFMGNSLCHPHSGCSLDFPWTIWASVEGCSVHCCCRGLGLWRAGCGDRSFIWCRMGSRIRKAGALVCPCQCCNSHGPPCCSCRSLRALLVRLADDFQDCCRYSSFCRNLRQSFSRGRQSCHLSWRDQTQVLFPLKTYGQPD